MSHFFPAFFSCNNNLNLSQSLLEFSNEKNVEITETTIADELSKIMRVLSLVMLSPKGFPSKNISIAKSNFFYPIN